MARVSNWRRNLDRGLEFFGLKEEAYPSVDFDDYVAGGDDPVVTPPTPPTYSSGVTVLGGASPRASFNTASTDAIYRDPTPPHGTPGFTSTAETTELELFVATDYGQCQAICDILKARRPVIVNTAHCDRDTSRRIVAFICGFIYMMNGRIQPLVKGSVILAEPIRSITVSPAAIDRFRLTRFER